MPCCSPRLGEVVLYFAYGSNLTWAQMKERCPSARFISTAKLPGFRLAFTRRSARRDCGVADAVSAAGSCLWGAIYDISDADVEQLDKSEGYFPGRQKNSYWRRECTVLVGTQEQALTVATY